MSASVVVHVSCDGRLSEERTPCPTSAAATMSVRLTHRGEIKGDVDLPDGWLGEVSMANNNFRIEHFCPSCGMKRAPWRYET
jgi:hypothetical protein